MQTVHATTKILKWSENNCSLGNIGPDNGHGDILAAACFYDDTN